MTNEKLFRDIQDVLDKWKDEALGLSECEEVKLAMTNEKESKLRKELKENYLKGGLIVCGLEEMERFIHSHTQEVVAKIEGMMKEELVGNDYAVGYNDGYNQALDEVLALLKEDNNK
jgi:hypothetical protein